MSDMATIEMASMENVLTLGIDNGIIIGAVQLILDEAGDSSRQNFERQLWGRLTLRSGIWAAGNDPKPTLTGSFAVVDLKIVNSD